MRCYGAGLELLGCIVNKPADFTIDTRGAGRGELKLYAQVRPGPWPDLPIMNTLLLCFREGKG